MKNIMSRNVGAEDYYYAKDGAFPTYDFGTSEGVDNYVEYYYDNSRDRFANRMAWIDLEADIVRVIVDPNLKAQEIDVIFDLVYADRKRQIASMEK
jgi:hypothetical protein